MTSRVTTVAMTSVKTIPHSYNVENKTVTYIHGDPEKELECPVMLLCMYEM